MRDLLVEVFAAMKGNKMRIALTGLAIAWGIFILIVLVSSGRGLINGMANNFRAYNVGVVTLTPRTTSQSFEGRQKGRAIYLYEDDAEYLASVLADTIAKAIPVVSQAVQARHGKGYTNTLVDGYAPGYAIAPNIRITEGRDINELDMQQHRKACVIPERLRKVFFGNDTASVVSRQLTLDGINFQIVGVYEPLLSMNVTRSIIAPLNTVKMIWCPKGHLSRLYLQTHHLDSEQLNKQFNARIVSLLAARKSFAPTDMNAVGIQNQYELPVLLSNIFDVLYVFIVIVGLATLVSGIVGVSNIMLISVKERTREIAIRRSVGAKGYHIVTLVLTESVIITLLFGYFGMFVGMGLMEGVAQLIVMTGHSNIFSNPTISPLYVIAVSSVMVVAGLLAGYIPAKQAVELKIVEAMNSK